MPKRLNNQADVAPGFYQSLVDELLSKFKRVEHFTQHAPTVGAYNEAILRRTIRELLPARFGVKTGFVYAGSGKASRQVDILVVDENDPCAYFMQDGDFAVIHPRALVCAIEVKTRLTKREFLSGFENFASLVECSKASKTRWPAQGMIFAFDSLRLTPFTLQGWYRDLKEVPEDSWLPMMVFSLSGECLQLRRAAIDGDNWGHYLALGDKDQITRGAFSVLLGNIRKLAELSSGIDGNPFESTTVEGLSRSEVFFRPGIGCCIPDQSVV